MSPALLHSFGMVHVGVARGAVHLVHGRGMVVLLGVNRSDHKLNSILLTFHNQGAV